MLSPHPAVQETDPGKFTIAFQDWRKAVLWAMHMKQQLSQATYPTDVLSLPEVAEVQDQAGKCVRRGVQPKVRRSSMPAVHAHAASASAARPCVGKRSVLLVPR